MSFHFVFIFSLIFEVVNFIQYCIVAACVYHSVKLQQILTPGIYILLRKWCVFYKECLQIGLKKVLREWDNLMLIIFSYFLFLCLLLLIFAQNNIHQCVYLSISKLCVLNNNKIFPSETLLQQYLLAKILTGKYTKLHRSWQAVSFWNKFYGLYIFQAYKIAWLYLDWVCIIPILLRL